MPLRKPALTPTQKRTAPLSPLSSDITKAKTVVDRWHKGLRRASTAMRLVGHIQGAVDEEGQSQVAEAAAASVETGV